jgi:hypothetical protein
MFESHNSCLLLFLFPTAIIPLVFQPLHEPVGMHSGLTTGHTTSHPCSVGAVPLPQPSPERGSWCSNRYVFAPQIMSPSTNDVHYRPNLSLLIGCLMPAAQLGSEPVSTNHGAGSRFLPRFIHTVAASRGVTRATQLL